MKRFAFLAAAMMAAAMMASAQGSREWPLTRANTGIVSKGGFFQLPVFTTATRPSSPVAGCPIWNSSTGTLQVWDGASWDDYGGGVGTWLSVNGGTILGSILGSVLSPPDLGASSAPFVEGWFSSAVNVGNATTEGNIWLFSPDGTVNYGRYGIDVQSANPETFNIQNSGAGNVTLQQDGKNVPAISTGTAAPSSTPSRIGDIYVDTSAKKLYFAAGTDSSADWIIAN